LSPSRIFFDHQQTDRSVIPLEDTMLKFYYHPLSPIARRVWLALLEKQIPYEPIVVHLNQREQFESTFLAINPFHHVPVLIDGDFRIIESLAILDYLELRFPTPALIPTAIPAIAKMRMVQMVSINELMSQMVAIISMKEQALPDTAQQRLETAWQFLEAELQGQPFFGGDHLSLGDVVAGCVIPLMDRLGVSPQQCPQLTAWRQRISDRPAWQQTEPSDADLQLWRRWLQLQAQRAKSRP
jgi:glutathione S-transferase